MANLARFTISGSPSSDRGYDMNPGETPVFSLEVSSSLVHRVTYEVRPVSADAGAPRASSGAPTLTLSNGVATGQSIDAVSPSSPVTISAGIPSLRAPHLWEVRCRVNDGRNPDASINPDYWFSRFIVMRSGLGLRKIVPTERNEYDPIDAWAGALNDLVSGFDVSLQTAQRIQDGLRVRLYIDGSPSVNEVIPGITGATSGGLSLARTGTGVFQFTCPTVTIDGVGYIPNRPIAQVEAGVAVVTSKIGLTGTTVEVRTYNASHAAADVSGLCVMVWVPYRRSV